MKNWKIVVMFMMLVASFGFAQTSNPPSLVSEVTVDGGNGYGSTSQYARRFANVDVNVGSDITYADSSTDGDSFTINTDGVYSVSYTAYSEYGETHTISLNSAGTISTNSMSAGNRLCSMSVPTGYLYSCSVSLVFAAGDVIRAHRSQNTSAADSNPFIRFEIVRIR